MKNLNFQNTDIMFTGGGSAGHVVPNLALIKACQTKGWHCSYIGMNEGLEYDLVAKRQDVPYYYIAAGKLRRYFSLKTFFEPFKILKGFRQARTILQKTQPKLVFSKGGFVAVPVVYAAYSLKIPVITHESDITPGLANRLCLNVAQQLCVSFASTHEVLLKKQKFAMKKIVVTGSPLRPELFEGDKEKGLAFCQWESSLKPILLVTGGGAGAQSINLTVQTHLSQLLANFRVIHLCGRGKKNDALQDLDYRQFEYIDKELPDLFACADFVIARAGANTIFELLSLKKPHVLVPISLKASRGDQIANAEYCQKLQLSIVVKDEDVQHNLLSAVEQLQKEKALYQERLAAANIQNGVDLILPLFEEYLNNKPTA